MILIALVKGQNDLGNLFCTSVYVINVHKIHCKGIYGCANEHKWNIRDVNGSEYGPLREEVRSKG